MGRTEFEQRLREAAARARDFGQTFVHEQLPESLRFRIGLNASYDGNPLHPDERVFPGDSSFALRSRFHLATAEEAVELLWRDGTTPEWINLSLAGELCGHTVLEMEVCGRYTNNEERLYHRAEGRPPFHVLGPALPPGYEEEKRFSVYQRSVCWTRPELEHVSRVVDRLWSLTLCGSELDDEDLERLPPADDGLELLELHETRVSGAGFPSLARHRALRLLRARLASEQPFDVGDLPERCRLDHLDLSNLPDSDWGFGRLRPPALTTLRLQSSHTLRLDGQVAKGVQEVSLVAPSARGLQLPKSLKRLSLSLSSASDSVVAELLSNVRSLSALHLRGTPVTDAFVEHLVESLGLQFLDLVDTAVTADCIQRVEAAHPRLRLLPRRSRVDLGYRLPGVSFGGPAK